MENLCLKKNKKGFVGTALLIAIFVIALVIVIFLALGKDDSIVYKSTTSNKSGNTKIIAKNDEEGNSKSVEADGDGVSCELLTAEEDKFQKNIEIMRDAAKSYFTVNRMPSTVGDKVTLTLKEMLDAKMVLGIKDNAGKACDTTKSYVEVTKNDDEYVMKVNLACDGMEDYILVNIGCYDFCNASCKTDVIKVYEYEYKKITACKLTDWSAWTNWSTKKESTNSNKKEEVKTEKKQEEVVESIDATKGKTTYNCDKYPGYTLSGTKCIKTTTSTDTIDATYSNKTYNCDKYPGYTLNGTKCEKKIEETKTYDAIENPATYNCDKYSGYTLSGTKCIKTVTSTETKDANVKYSCASGYTLNGTKCGKTTSRTETKDATASYSCPSGYTLSGTKCTKKTTTTDTKAATVVYGTRNIDVEYKCNEQKCTTKTVMDCSNGCQMVPQTSCESVPKTCHKTVSQQYVSGYRCESGYTLSGTQCSKTTTTTDTKDATVSYNCPSNYSKDGNKCIRVVADTDIVDAKKSYNCAEGYTLSGTKCSKTTTNTDTKDAVKNTTTYNCNKYSGASLSGNKCVIKTTTTDTKNATESGGGYVCKTGYKLDGNKCSKTITNTETKDATAVVGKTSCPTGYNLNGSKCTKKTTKNIEIKYYRYSTRDCTGGSTDIKWSKDSYDKTLISSGYTKTGNKKLITK